MPPARTNPVVHLELHTGDLPRARAFYAELCGWRPERIEPARGSYLALELGGGLGGGIVECATQQSAVAALRRGRRDRRGHRPGAAVSAPLFCSSPAKGPAGWRSVVATPAGGEIAFWQQKR